MSNNNELLKKLKSLKDKQKLLMKDMSKEKCDDIHSVRRSMNFANGIIELEIKIEYTMDLLLNNNELSKKLK
jgi:hypothetical protein